MVGFRDVVCYGLCAAPAEGWRPSAACVDGATATPLDWAVPKHNTCARARTGGPARLEKQQETSPSTTQQHTTPVKDNTPSHRAGHSSCVATAVQPPVTSSKKNMQAATASQSWTVPDCCNRAVLQYFKHHNALTTCPQIHAGCHTDPPRPGQSSRLLLLLLVWWLFAMRPKSHGIRCRPQPQHLQCR